MLLLGFIPFATANAQQPLPKPVGYVNDFAHVLTPEAAATIESLALRVNAATRGDMVVVTLSDLGGRPVEEVALRLGREWKIGADAAIGDAARNAGVVILLVPKETSSDGRGYCRIEVGQGAEGFITDATSGALCREQTPLFRAQNYSAALVQLSAEVADRYAKAFGVTLDSLPIKRRASQSDDDGQLATILLLIVVTFIVIGMNRRGRGGNRGGCVGCMPLVIPGPGWGSGNRHDPWGGGGGGGWGGGGFGGGGFGGFGGGGGFSGGGGGSSW